MDPLGGWTTARRCPRTPDRGSAPVKRHSRIAVAGEQPHPRSRMGRSRRQTHRTTPTSGIGGLRRAAAQHPSSPPDRGGRERLPRPRKPPPGPQPPTSIGRPGVFLRDRDRPIWGLVTVVSILVLLGQEWPLAHSATPPPPPTPKSPSPDPGAILFRGIWAGRTLPGGASRRRKHPCSPRGPSHIRRNARPDTAPFVPRACRSRPHPTTIQNRC
jgi:hypothetical protein